MQRIFYSSRISTLLVQRTINPPIFFNFVRIQQRSSKHKQEKEVLSMSAIYLTCLNSMDEVIEKNIFCLIMPIPKWYIINQNAPQVYPRKKLADFLTIPNLISMLA